MQVKEIMTDTVITVTPDEQLSTVAEMLFDNNLTGMPVVNEEYQVMGIVTEYDFMSPELKMHIPTYINFLNSLQVVDDPSVQAYKDEARKLGDSRVEEIMTKKVITVRPTTDVKTLVELITTHRINPIPVVDQQNKLVGIVSRADLMRILRASDLR